MGEFANSFRDLDVYQDALNLSLDIHEFAKSLPIEERYVLADQMRRASRSVPANISEAWLPARRDMYVCCVCN
ncbi:four helix bundle protein [Pontiella desulfatans]|uniref:four helix bundle protein n=1 Tax=Pontiella desulfatans TaxID=2750659 RepID=UPI00109C67A5